MGITLLLRTSLGSSEKKWETCAGRACSWSYHIPSSGISHSCECHRLDAYFNMNATPEWLTITYLWHKPWHNQYGTPQGNALGTHLAPPDMVHLHCWLPTWPILLSKTNLSDGFYQFHLTPSVSLSIAKPFLDLPGEPPLVAIPTRLPMEWTKSPPAFSAITDTVAYFINESI